MRVAVLMPAFGEGAALTRTLRDLRDRAREVGEIHLFLVDDGSDPAIDEELVPAATPELRVVLARHAVNLGQGAALETARQLALAGGPFDAYVTMDADGQHDARDLVPLVRAIANGADLALGNRFAGGSNPPALRRALVHAARAFERIAVGARLGDAHNGFRAFSRRGLERARLRESRMAHATEIASLAARAERERLRVVEVPVSVRYTAETLAKGQRAGAAFAIVRDLFHTYLFGDSESHET
jgi:glycosyltransferase involved in cell wall biosynthesis